MNYCIENQYICFRVDEHGRPYELYNKKHGVNYIRPYNFWRLIIQDKECLEVEVIPGDSPAIISEKDNHLLIRYPDAKERFSGKLLDIEINIAVYIDKDQINPQIKISNKQPGAVVKELHFPLLAIDETTLEGVVTTYTGGQYFKDVKSKIMQAHTQFKGIDQYYIRDVNSYPANAMNCMLADHGDEGLYLGCHDNDFELTSHILELDDKRDFNMVMARFPYLKTGEIYSFDKFILSPYSGKWHVAAEKYRSWADSWYHAPELPETIKESNGWQRIIMRTQYGRVLFPYDSLGKAFDDAQSAGIDSLFLFGWHSHGMDNGYPDYSFDEPQGGINALKKSIKEVQARGGKIILYFNGQLIDRRSDYFLNGGEVVSTKLTNGESELHCYSFPGPGITAAKFGNRTFTTACPSSEEWLDILKSFIDTAIELEVDSVFFDQIGNLSYPCCDPNHGHPVPYIGINDARMHQLKELRSYLKARRPAMGLGIEWLADVTAQHVDFVHIWGNIADSIAFQEFYHYAFPETIFSNREIRTDEDIERRVNVMLLKGCVSDVEIYRCQSTIAETPNYQKYLSKTNIFRDKYKDFFVNGKFLADSRKYDLDNQELSIASWSKDNMLAIMLSQSHLEKSSGKLSIPGYSLVEYDSISGDAKINDEKSLRVELPRHSLVILIFKRVNG